MAHWIFIEEGRYEVQEAFIFTPAYTAMPLEDALLDVYVDGSEERRVKGEGLGANVLMIELLEDHDDLDLLVNLGDGFMYILKAPVIKGGKVFAHDVKSTLLFYAKGPLQKLSGREYADIRSKLDLLQQHPS